VSRTIAVVGANGQVGSDIVKAGRRAGFSIVEWTHRDLEIRHGESVRKAIASLAPDDVVVNTAAFHRTDECEAQPQRALEVNVSGAYHVAAAAAQAGAHAVQISSDYVFDGMQSVPYVETDAPHPLNVYGASKAAAEMLVAAANPQHYIVRISSVFGTAGSSGKGGNFVETMVAKARGGQAPEVVDDLVMAPTFAHDAASLLIDLLRLRAAFGVYHLANSGQCSWFEFACAIFEMTGSALRPRPIHSSAHPAGARRPPYSVLASTKLHDIGLQPRPWTEALKTYLQEKGYTR